MQSDSVWLSLGQTESDSDSDCLSEKKNNSSSWSELIWMIMSQTGSDSDSDSVRLSWNKKSNLGLDSIKKWIIIMYIFYKSRK